MEEDIIVMGSDGLFDNLFDQEIISVVGSCDNASDAGMVNYSFSSHEFKAWMGSFCCVLIDISGC